MLTLVVLFAFADPPKITISKETTYITSPLCPDGVVDYVGAMNERLKSIKPEDNAAVLLVKAIGRESASDKIAVEYHRLLKSERPPEKGAYLVDFNKYLAEKNADHDDAAVEALKRCQTRPWKTAEQPLLAEYVRLNEAPLKLVVEASRRPRCVTPYLTGQDPPMIISVLLGMHHGCRTALRPLMLRAMLNSGEGRLDAAFEDVDTAHRLATLLGREAQTLIEVLVAIAIRDAALHAEQALAFTDRPEEFLRRRAAAVVALPPAGDIVDCFDRTERMNLLNMTLYSMVYGSVVIDGRKGSKPNSFDGETIDEALRTVNGFVDRYVKAMRAKPGDGSETIGQIEDELAERGREARERQGTFFLFRKSLPPHPRGPKAAAGQAYADIMLNLLLPAVGASTKATARTKAVQRQTALAYALAAHKSKHGSYPNKLDAAALGLPPETTLDAFTGKPFAYETADGKRRVISAGLDGVIGSKDAAKNATAADRAMRRPVDDLILELP